MNICAIDFETTGKEPKECRITEAGAALVQPQILSDLQTEKMQMITLSHLNLIVYEEEYAPQTPEVLEVTPHLTDEVLKAKGVTFKAFLDNLVSMFEHQGWPEYMLAHNAEFDSTVFKSEMTRHKEELKQSFSDDVLQRLWNMQWICSIKDITWSEKYTCKKLSHLALDHGVKMDNRTLHKAIDDVFLLVDLLEKAQVDWIKIIEQIKVPWVTVRAVIPLPYGPKGDGGVGKDKCKENKFRYETLGDITLAKTWLKRIKEDQVAHEESLLGYPLRIVNTANG